MAYIRLIEPNEPKTVPEHFEPSLKIDKERMVNTMCPWYPPESFKSTAEQSDFQQ